MPGARRTRSLACEMKQAHERRHHGFSQVHPAFPHAMVLTVSFALSPVTGLFCHCHQRKLHSANLTPASGRQDHTTSPSATRALVRSASRVHHIPLSTFVTIAKRPFCEAGWRRYRFDLGDLETGKFFQTRLDRANQIDPVQEIGLSGNSRAPCWPTTSADEARKTLGRYHAYPSGNAHGPSAAPSFSGAATVASITPSNPSPSAPARVRTRGGSPSPG